MLLSLLLKIILQEDLLCNEALVALANRYSKRTVHLFSDAPIEVVKSLEVPVLLNVSSVDQQWQTDTFVVLTSNVSMVARFLLTKPIAYNRYTPWILGLTTVSTEGLRYLFETAFDKGILNMVALLRVNSSVHIYDFLPFRPNGSCYNFAPRIVDVYTSGKFVYGTNLFPKNKVDNIQGCPIKSVLFPFLPYIKFSFTDRSPLGGTAAPVFNSVKQAMNFKPLFVVAPNEAAGVNLMRDVHTALGFGLPSYVPGVDHGSTLMYRCISWCVPSVFDIVRGWRALTNTFRSDLWLLCLAALAAATIATKYLILKPENEPKVIRFPWWLLSWAIMVEKPQPQVQATRLRVFISCLFFAFVIINTVFKARLHLLMTGKPVPMRISDLEGIYDGSLDLYTQYGNNWLSDEFREGGSLWKRLHPYSRLDTGSLVKVREALTGGSAAVLATTDYCYSLATELGKTTGGYYKVYALPTCVVSVRGTYFSFAFESPFADRVRKVSTHLWEHGLSERFFVNTVQREIISAQPVPMNLADMLGVFSVLASGWVLGVLIFVIEVFRIPDKVSKLRKKQGPLKRDNLYKPLSISAWDPREKSVICGLITVKPMG